MPSRIKEIMLQEYTSQIEGMGDMFAVSYSGLNVSENNDLRTQLFSSGNRLMHVRNSIFKRALSGVGMDDFANLIDGPTGIVFGEDVISAVKIIDKLSKDFKGISMSVGRFEDKILSSQELTALSKIPSKEVLYSQVMMTIKAPIVNAASLLQGITRKLIMTIKELEKKT